MEGRQVRINRFPSYILFVNQKSRIRGCKNNE